MSLMFDLNANSKGKKEGCLGSLYSIYKGLS